MTTTVTSRELNQNSSRVQRKAEKEPVIITKRGKPNLVMLSFEEYQQSTGSQSILEALSSPEVADIEIELTREPMIIMRPAEFD